MRLRNDQPMAEGTKNSQMGQRRMLLVMQCSSSRRNSCRLQAAGTIRLSEKFNKTTIYEKTDQ